MFFFAFSATIKMSSSKLAREKTLINLMLTMLETIRGRFWLLAVNCTLIPYMNK